MTDISLPFNYLSVPLFKGKPSKRAFTSFLDIIKFKMEGWQDKALSIAGRIQLVKSVVYGKLSYIFSIYRWPALMLKQLDQFIRNFIWTRICSKKKLAVPSLVDMCKPYKDGGNLAIHEIKIISQTYMPSIKKNHLTCYDVFQKLSQPAFINL